MNIRCLFLLGLVCLPLSTAWAESQALPPGTPDGVQLDRWLAEKTVELRPDQLGRWAVQRNAKTIAQRAQVDSVTHLVEAEKALYDPMVTLSSSRSFSRQARSSADISADVQRLISCGLDPECEGSIEDLQLEVRQLTTMNGYGVQARAPTGAIVELRHGVQGSQNNMTDPRNVMEATGTLVLSVSQPLLKGFGPDVTEADLQVAQREYDVEVQNLQRQMLDTLGEAVGAYWQLYQSEQTIFWRKDAIKMGEAALEEVRARHQAGYGNPLEINDAQVALNERKIELLQAQQKWSEVQARLRSALNLPGDQFKDVRFATAADLDLQASASEGIDEDQALALWPSYRIAQLREQQEQIRLRYADNQRMPDLSLDVSYSKSLLSNSRKKSLSDVNESKDKGWSVGLTLSRPLMNMQANSKYDAQKVKVWAAAEAVRAERAAWANEVVARQQQLASAEQALQARRAAVSMREEALRLQQEQFKAGRSRIRAVLERQDQLNDSRLKAVEATVGWKLAILQLEAVSADVLANHGIALVRQ